MSRAMPIGGRQRGFTLIELMIVIALIAVLAGIAMPSYTQYVTRSSRGAVQAELVELAGVQDMIFLNSNAYTANVTGAYTGSSTGGLGWSSGKSRDTRYTLTATVVGASFTLTATPVAGTSQAGDGNLSINSQGIRTWGSTSW
jgi:type IV pilus assembly protein PilE